MKTLDDKELPNPPEIPGESEEEAPSEKTGPGSVGKNPHQKTAAADLRAELAEAQEQIQNLLQEAQEKEQEIDRLKDLYLRAHAQMENLKKRTAKEKEDFAKYSQESLLLSLLPVVDNLERALEAAQNRSEAEQTSVLQEGVTLTLKHFLEILEKAGVKPVEAQGVPFDPHFHHAVMQVETAEAAEGMVVEVLQKGYLLKDRLLRPAMVKVSAAPN